jgi:putative oxidoreductase
LGRILFALLFIVSGASKLFDIAGTAQSIADHVIVPASLAGYVGDIEALTTMSFSRLLAIAAGAVEFVCGVLIAFNIGIRFFCTVLFLFVLTTIFYFHDFWNQTGADSRTQMVAALKNLSLIGALLVLAGHGRAEQEDLPSPRKYNEL